MPITRTEPLTEMFEETEESIVWWSRHSKELKGSVSKLSAMLALHDCIQYIGWDKETGFNSFISLPLSTSTEVEINGVKFFKKAYETDYNKETTYYKLWQDNSTRWHCQCQGWQTRERNTPHFEGVQCKHIVALYMHFKLEAFRKKKVM